MLLKSRISKITPHSDEWFKSRIGRLTGSNIHVFCIEKGIGAGANTYLRRKAAERIEKKTFDPIIDTYATSWGNLHERAALDCFLKMIEEKTGQKQIHVNPSVIHYDDLFSCTPDMCLIPKIELVTNGADTAYHTEPVEAKCLQIDKHLEFLEISTPEELKKLEPKFYWQVISQIVFTDSLRGHFINFHPEMEGNMKLNHIEFKAMDLNKDIKFFKNRLEEARLLYWQKVDALKATYKYN